MGLNWQHTIWNINFEVGTEKLMFIWLADKTFDSANGCEFTLEDLEVFVGISKRHAVRIFAKYSDIANYQAGKGRGCSSKIIWKVQQKGDTQDAKGDVGDIFLPEKGDIKGDTPPHTPQEEFNLNTTETTNTLPPKNSANEKKRGSRIPIDFYPSEKMIQFALKTVPNIDLELRITEFKNFWESKTGKDATKLDWQKTFQNRIIQIKQFNDRKYGVNQNGSTEKPNENKPSNIAQVFNTDFSEFVGQTYPV